MHTHRSGLGKFEKSEEKFHVSSDNLMGFN